MLRVKVDMKVFERGLRGLEKQIPYAVSAAINLSLFAARPKVIAGLRDHFAIRTPFVPRGVHVNTSTKHTLTGDIGFLPSRWFMESQVMGDPARKKPGGKPIWQPLETGPRSPRPRHDRPILAKRRPNVASAKDTGKKTKHGIVNRVGYFRVLKSGTRPGARQIWPGIYYRPNRKERRIVAAYWLEPFTKIEPRYPLGPIVEDIVARVLPDMAVKAMERAIKTAK
jgi:hypothetical protein